LISDSGEGLLPYSVTTLRPKTFVHIYKTTRCHASENHGLDTNHLEHFISYSTVFFLETAAVLSYRVFCGPVYVQS